MKISALRPIARMFAWGLLVASLASLGCESRSNDGGAGASSGSEASPSDEAPEGPAMPSLEATRLEDEGRTTLSHDGRPTLINLWATWCAPCLVEMPLLKKVRERWSTDQLRMIGLSVQGPKSRKKIQSFVDKEGVPFDEVWFAPGSNPLSIFGAGAVPATYLYGADGQLLWSHDGKIEKEQLKALEQTAARAVSSG